MSRGLAATVAGLWLACSLIGCRLIDAPVAEPEPKSPIKPIKLADNGVALEVVHVRVPAANTSELAQIWQHADETQFSPELRSQLTWNGFRTGVLAGQLPAALEKVILRAEPERSDQPSELKSADELTATSRILFLRPGNETHFQTSGIYERINLLRLDSTGQLSGAPYSDAQGVLIVRAIPEPGGRVRLKMLPELHHGMLKTHFATDPGLTGHIRPHAKKDKLVFSALDMDVMLARGQMLIVGAHEGRSGTAGHYFFTDESSGNCDHKLILCRLSESKWDELFAKHTKPAEPPAEK